MKDDPTDEHGRVLIKLSHYYVRSFPKADTSSGDLHVSFVPKADASNRSNPLFDHLIGERET
jgi:hypothetical protein